MDDIIKNKMSESPKKNHIQHLTNTMNCFFDRDQNNDFFFSF